MDQKRVLLETISFLESRQGQRLSCASREEIRTIMLRFFRAIFHQLGKRPQDLDGEDMRTLLSELLPMHFSERDPLGKYSIEIFSNYLDFLEEQHVVPSLFELRNQLVLGGGEFEKRIREGKGTGDGQPLGNQKEPVRHRGKKVGRNDPCPCGSGKKFKKCCMHLGED